MQRREAAGTCKKMSKFSLSSISLNDISYSEDEDNAEKIQVEDVQEALLEAGNDYHSAYEEPHHDLLLARTDAYAEAGIFGTPVEDADEAGDIEKGYVSEGDSDMEDCPYDCPPYGGIEEAPQRSNPTFLFLSDANARQQESQDVYGPVWCYAFLVFVLIAGVTFFTWLCCCSTGGSTGSTTSNVTSNLSAEKRRLGAAFGRP
ncbi:unnamed protein product [Amoebophrya sp. A25]|nr:unnamed protein product [Amoebophrya sp. A25]|eukprot:GSA25T00001572001.1